MAYIFRPAYNRIDPETGKRVRRKLKRWYVRYRDADGIVRKVPGFKDKEATKALAHQLETKAARKQVGLIDPFEDTSSGRLPNILPTFAGRSSPRERRNSKRTKYIIASRRSASAAASGSSPTCRLRASRSFWRRKDQP